MSTVLRNGRSRLPLLRLSLALLAITAHAQVDTGTILGTELSVFSTRLFPGHHNGMNLIISWE